MLGKIERIIDRFSNITGWIAAGLLFVMLVNVFYDAIMRYFFRSGSIALQELEWHIFSVVFLFGISYALKEDGHVRVDVFYDRFSPRWKAIVNIAGTFIFLIPLALLIIDGSTWFVNEAYEMNEISGDPGGLTRRYLIKAVIPVSFVFLTVSACGFVVRNLRIFFGEEAPPVHHLEDDVL
jgi:TRAP-type mannitol/chloroaromatic compound transport system permease small subunit